MLAEGDFEIAMEDELSDSGTEASTDYETYDLETEEPNDETEEETDESEAEAKTKSNKSATDETCELVTSKPNRPIAHAISQHGVKIGISGKIKEDCKMLESEEKKSRKVVNNGSKPRDIRRYCCQICGLVRAKRKRLETHIMLHHGAEIGATEIDKLIEKKNPEDCEAKKDGKCESNGIKVRELRRYCCKLCGPVRSKRELLENHIILEHSEEMNSKGEMNKFVVKRRSEDDQRRYSCQMCGVLRSKRTLLKLHILSSHGVSFVTLITPRHDYLIIQYGNEIFNFNCSARFASEGLGKHSCVCNMCGMSFSKPSHLQQHKISHSALEVLRHRLKPPL